MKRCYFSLMVIGLVLLTTAAAADDFAPAPFRGQPLTVFVEWDFVLDFNPDRFNIIPDALTTNGDGMHALGTAFTHAHASDTVHWTSDPGQPGDGRAETFAEPGQIDFFLVNWEDDYPYKTIRVQITFGGQGVPFVSEVVGPNASTDTWTDPTYGWPAEMLVWGPGQVVETWVLQPNPNREHVYIDIPSFTWIDQVVFDTISATGPIAVQTSSMGRLKALYEN